ncbi:MAG: fimbrillin family protein [Candidatus Cryptobacteroides sp.]
MKIRHKREFLWSVLAVAAGMLCAGCSKGTEDAGENGNGSGQENRQDGEEERLEIRLAPGFTKVAEDCFEAGDRIGVFMTYGDGAETYLDNQEFTAVYAVGTLEWNAETKLWWKNETTPADFYCYHPYTQDATGFQMLQCRVMADQSTHKAFSDSDILWGENLQVAPTSDCVELMTSHRTGQVVIELVPGKGYDSGTLSASLESIVLKGAVCGAVLDLKTGSLTASGSPEDVTPNADGLIFKALVPPQNIENFEVKLTVAGIERSLKTSLEIASNHRKRCTLTVNKLTEGVNVGIGGWEDDDEDFGGILN